MKTLPNNKIEFDFYLYNGLTLVPITIEIKDITGVEKNLEDHYVKTIDSSLKQHCYRIPESEYKEIKCLVLHNITIDKNI